jgi:hypothetical protein
MPDNEELFNDSDEIQSSDVGPVYRHEARERDFEPALGDESNIEAIADHIEKHIGPVDKVFHELISDLVHIDIHIVAPTKERNFYTLVTSGMSDKAMNAPDAQWQFAELMMCLPSGWPLEQNALDNEDNYWPIRWLKMMARLPHEYETWLGFGHTVPNGDPPAPFAANTEFCCMLVLPPPIYTPKEFHRLETENGKIINFYALIPLYKEEMNLKMRQGTEALFDGFDKHGVSEVVNLSRNNIARKGRWFFG